MTITKEQYQTLQMASNWTRESKEELSLFLGGEAYLTGEDWRKLNKILERVDEVRKMLNSVMGWKLDKGFDNLSGPDKDVNDG